MQRLSKDTVRLLSCSQVITSVHSVVKELVENALDAKATSINIRLENYGLDVIEVKDNGSGVKRSDIPHVALPHSTSKIANFDDLCTLETYGFRGEALHSLAAVASLCVLTRTDTDNMAYRYVFSCTGEVASSAPVAMGTGTTVIITQLFINFPVRRQTYRSIKRCKDDLRKVEDYLLAFGICHPGVRFQLRHNKHTLWQKPPAPSFQANVANVLGASVFHQMSPLNYQCFNPMVKLAGFVPKADCTINTLTRPTPDRLFVLVNKRPVLMKSLVKLIKTAFGKAFPSSNSRYPIGVLSISVLPQAVDVNLEPNKTSVLLHDIDFISTTLSSLLEQTYGPCKVMGQDSKSEGGCVHREGTLVRSEVEGEEQRGGSVGGGVQVRSEVEGVEQGGGSVGESGVQVRSEVEGEEQRGGSVGGGVQVRSEVEGEEQRGWSVGEGGVQVRSEVEGELDTRQPLLECEDFTDLTVDMMEDLESESKRGCEERECQKGERGCEEGEERGCEEGEERGCEEEEERGYEEGEERGCVEEEERGCAVLPSSNRFQMTLSQWSRGDNFKQVETQFASFSTSGRNVVDQPVQVCPPPTSSLAPPATPTSATPTQVQPNLSKLAPKGPAPVFDMIHSKPVKRKAPSIIPDTSKKQRRLQESTWRGNGGRGSCSVDDMVCTEIKFDMAGVTERNKLMASGDFPQQVDTPPNKVIGWCDLKESRHGGIWLVVQDSTIAGFNVCRGEHLCAQELTSVDVQKLLDTSNNDKNQMFHNLHKM